MVLVEQGAARATTSSSSIASSVGRTPDSSGREVGAERRIKGSSERYGLPVALAALKLPTGAITAVLRLILMRDQFVPGLSALDTSAQILVGTLVFRHTQQLFARFVDQQGQTVLDNVRGARRPEGSSTPD